MFSLFFSFLTGIVVIIRVVFVILASLVLSALICLVLGFLDFGSIATSVFLQ